MLIVPGYASVAIIPLTLTPREGRMLGVMFSIGEFARLGGVSVRTLRHYDEIGLLRPTAIDQDTGYRGYSASQLGPLNRIVALKDLRLSLTQIRRLLDGITLDELHGMLILRRAQLEHEVHQHMNQLLGVEARPPQHRQGGCHASR